MLCLRCSAVRSLNAMKQLPENAARRTLRTARPSQSPYRLLSSVCRSSLQNTPIRPSTGASVPSLSSQASQPRLPNRAIPPLSSASLFSQSSFRYFSASAVLGAPRNTFNPSRRVQKRRHGFLSRLRTRGGRKILQRRRKKGRRNMSW